MVENTLAASNSPLSGIILPSGIAFYLEESEPFARWILRGDIVAAKAAAEALGVTIPVTPCDAGHADDRAALWLGPDEWLLLVGIEEKAVFQAQLEMALQPFAHSLVDVSHRQIGLSITGANAARALSAGCPLDFYRTAFPVDMVTRTIFMKSEIMIWRRAETHFHVEVARSFAQYLARHLIEAARHAPPL